TTPIYPLPLHDALPISDDAYLMQNSDGRIVFALPYEERFTLIGTTDVAYTGDPATVAIDEGEITYLLDLASRFFRTPLHRHDIRSEEHTSELQSRENLV